MKYTNQSDSCPSPQGISAPCNWNYPISDYYGTADLLYFSSCCNTPNTGSQTFPNLYPCGHRPLKPLGRYLTPEESNYTLNHSFRVVPYEYCISWGICRKTSHIYFLQGSPFRMSSALTMLHSFS